MNRSRLWNLLPPTPLLFGFSYSFIIRILSHSSHYHLQYTLSVIYEALLEEANSLVTKLEIIATSTPGPVVVQLSRSRAARTATGRQLSISTSTRDETSHTGCSQSMNERHFRGSCGGERNKYILISKWKPWELQLNHRRTYFHNYVVSSAVFLSSSTLNNSSSSSNIPRPNLNSPLSLINIPHEVPR